ncbi:F-box protein At2g17036-like [Rosa rugosa]|uniref:F-box protein At2g17036-like n=1 Tax=Rosa rugosa TaxID=74645 RepID=UPI002B40A270|nr:F-box protein At2g17036-like [Rosa rugosa]
MNPGWAGLPKDLLGLVLEGLVSSSDYLRFSVVCKSWFSVAKDNQRQRISRFQQPPMLLISSADEENSWNLYNVVDDKVLDMQLRVPNRRFCGSSKGWLIFVDESFAVTLLNPFCSNVRGKKKKTNVTIIRLPPLHGKKVWIKRCDYYVFKAILSADPILDPKDCILTVINAEYGRLAFIRPSSRDKRWTYVDRKWGLIEEVVYSEGKIYAVDNNSQLFSFDINSLSKLELGQGLSSDGFSKRYLVFNSNKKQFWMVQRYIHYQKDKRETTKFKVFKMNFDEHEWIEIETLDDVAVFVGDNSSVSVAASDFPGCRSNCIYFSHDEDTCGTLEPYGPNDCGVYEITSHRFLQPYLDDSKKLLKLTRQPPIWFVPSFQL